MKDLLVGVLSGTFILLYLSFFAYLFWLSDVYSLFSLRWLTGRSAFMWARYSQYLPDAIAGGFWRVKVAALELKIIYRASVGAQLIFWYNRIYSKPTKLAFLLLHNSHCCHDFCSKPFLTNPKYLSSFSVACHHLKDRIRKKPRFFAGGTEAPALEDLCFPVWHTKRRVLSVGCAIHFHSMRVDRFHEHLIYDHNVTGSKNLCGVFSIPRVVTVAILQDQSLARRTGPKLELEV